MSASRACFAFLRSGPADPQHGRFSYGSVLAPGSLFPHATLMTTALRASLPSARIVATKASLSSSGTSGISSGLTEAGTARLNDGENLGAIRLRGFGGHPVNLQKLLEASRLFAADAAQRALGQSAADATAFRYRSARALQATEKIALVVRQRPCVLGAHDAVDGHRAVIASSAPSVIRGFLAEVAQNAIASAGVFVPAEIPHVEGEPPFAWNAAGHSGLRRPLPP